MEVCFTYLLALNFFSGAYQQFKNCKFQLVLPAFSELSREKKCLEVTFILLIAEQVV